MSHDLKSKMAHADQDIQSKRDLEALPKNLGEFSKSTTSTQVIHKQKIPFQTLSLMAGILAIIGFMIWQAPAILQAQNAGPQVEISSWSATTSLPVPVAGRNALVRGDYVYLFGGRDGQDSSTNSIYRAPILANGTLGTWEVAGTMPVPLYLHATVASGNFVYIIGGWNTTEPTDALKPNNSVWRGQILADGRIGNWVAENAYPVRVTLHQAVVVGQRIFVLGGYDGLRSRPIDNVYFANINPTTGQLGPWQPSSSLPQVIRRASAATAAVGGTTYIFLTGGSGIDTDSAFDTVYFSAVNSDGTLAGWQAGPFLPDTRRYHASVIHDGRLLVLGGENGDGEYSTVFAADINLNGSLSAWRSLASMPATTYRFAAVSVRRFGSDFVVALGGYVDETPKRNVYHSTIPNTPTPLPTNTPLPTATPTPSLSVNFDRSPNGWIGPGESVAYSIEFQAPSVPISNVQLESKLPQNMVLLSDSLSEENDYEYTVTDNTIFWQIGNVDALGTGKVIYEMARPTPAPPPSNIPPALRITLFGPSNANAGEPIEYRLELKNQSVIPLTDIVVVNTIPFGATYIDGNDISIVSGELSWQVPVLSPLVTETFTYTVVANHTLLNNSYRVDSKEGASAVGYVAITTNIDNRRPLVGDGFFIVHDGAQLSWESSDSTFQIKTDALTNPSFSYYVPLHAVSQ